MRAYPNGLPMMVLAGLMATAGLAQAFVTRTTYESNYPVTEAVRVYRGVEAALTVEGSMMDTANPIVVSKPDGSAAPGLTVTAMTRAANRTVLRVASTPGVVLGDYRIRIGALDQILIRVFDHGRIDQIALDSGNPLDLDVGTTVTATLTGDNLTRAECCGGTLADDAGILSVEPVNRGDASAQFRITFARGKERTLEAKHFYDGSAPVPSATGDACYAGSAKLRLVAHEHPVVTGLSPGDVRIATQVTLTGRGLVPRGWKATVLTRPKYATGADTATVRSTFTNVDGTGLRFAAPNNTRPDGIQVRFERNTEADFDSLPGFPTYTIPVPRIGVGERPDFTRIFSIDPDGVLLSDEAQRGVLISTSTPPILAGTRVKLFGKNLVPISTQTSVLTLITGQLQSSIPNANPNPTLVAQASGGNGITVVWSGVSLPVLSSRYSPAGDEVLVSVPSFEHNRTGTISLATLVGADSVPSVPYARHPEITAVQRVLFGRFLELGRDTLEEGATYRVLGHNLKVANRSFTVSPGVLDSRVSVNSGATADSMTFFITEVLREAGGSPVQVFTPLAGSARSANTYRLTGRPQINLLSTVIFTPSTVVGGGAPIATIGFQSAFTAGNRGQILATVAPEDAFLVPQTGLVSIAGNPFGFLLPTQPTKTRRTVLVTFTSSIGGAPITVPLTLRPPQPTALNASSDTLHPGQSFTLTAPVDGAVPSSAGIDLAVSSSDPATFTTGPMRINGASAAASFFAPQVSSPRPVTVTVSIDGVSRSVNLLFLPTEMTSLTLAPGNVLAGGTGTGKASFVGASSGLTLSLASSDPAVLVPASITLQAQSASQPTFNFTASSELTEPRQVTVTATLGGATRSASVSVAPIPIASFTLAPAAIPGGEQSAATVRLGARVTRAGGQRVEFESSDPALVAAPTPVVVGVNGDNTLVSLRAATGAVGLPRTVTLTARLRAGSDAGAPVVSTSTATLTVNP